MVYDTGKALHKDASITEGRGYKTLTTPTNLYFKAQSYFYPLSVDLRHLYDDLW